MRRGIRPDFQQFVSLMGAVYRQAERGVPTPMTPGNFVFDPLADARGVLQIMSKVTPKLHPGSALLVAHMRLVLLCVQQYSAKLADAFEVVALQQQLVDSLVVCDDDLYLRRAEHWNAAYFDFLGADLNFFNLYLEVIKETITRGEMDSGVRAATECLQIMNRSHIPGDNVTKALLFEIVEIADKYQHSPAPMHHDSSTANHYPKVGATSTHQNSHENGSDPLESPKEILLRAAGGMPDLCDDDMETRTLRKAKRMPHATCFDGASHVDYFAKPLDFMVQEPWLGLKDIDVC